MNWQSMVILSPLDTVKAIDVDNISGRPVREREREFGKVREKLKISKFMVYYIFTS